MIKHYLIFVLLVAAAACTIELLIPVNVDVPDAQVNVHIDLHLGDAGLEY